MAEKGIPLDEQVSNGVGPSRSLVVPLPLRCYLGSSGRGADVGAGIHAVIWRDQDRTDGLLGASYTKVKTPSLTRELPQPTSLLADLPWKTVMKLKYWLDVRSMS